MSIARQFQKPAPGSAARGETLDLKLARLDGGTQSRVCIDTAVVQDYAEDIAEGVAFPPITVFYDGTDYWCGDGFHRVHAHMQAGKSKIAVEVRPGTRRDAVLHSVGANAAHGLQRSRADKRRAVEKLLADEEWAAWSDREIARRCAVSHELVRQMREPVTVNIDSERTYTTKHGTTAVMDTSAIGNKPATEPEIINPPDDMAAENHAAFHEVARASLPQAIKDREQANAEWRARAAAGNPHRFGGLTAEDRIAELEEAVRVLEAEAETLRAENKRFDEMRVQFEQGGYEAVIAGKDEEIRVLSSRIASESAEKVRNLNAMEWWKRQAISRGWSNDEIIPLDEPQDVGGEAHE